MAVAVTTPFASLPAEHPRVSERAHRPQCGRGAEVPLQLRRDAVPGQRGARGGLCRHDRSCPSIFPWMVVKRAERPPKNARARDILYDLVPAEVAVGGTDATMVITGSALMVTGVLYLQRVLCDLEQVEGAAPKVVLDPVLQLKNLLIPQTRHSLYLRRPPRTLVGLHKPPRYRKVAVAHISDTPPNRGVLNNAQRLPVFDCHSSIRSVANHSRTSSKLCDRPTAATRQRPSAELEQNPKPDTPCTAAAGVQAARSQPASYNTDIGPVC